MQQSEKRIISTALSSIILVANTSPAWAISSFLNSESSQSSSSSDDELPPPTTFYGCPESFNNASPLSNYPYSFVGTEMDDEKGECSSQETSEDSSASRQSLQTQPDKTQSVQSQPTEIPSTPSPSFEILYDPNLAIESQLLQNQPIQNGISIQSQPPRYNFIYLKFPFKRDLGLKFELTDEELYAHLAQNSYFGSNSESTNTELSINSLNFPVPRLVRISPPSRQEFKAPAERFKPVKTQESTSCKTPTLNLGIKRLNPNSFPVRIVEDHPKVEEKITFDQAFDYIADYIFEKSLPVINDIKSGKNLSHLKNLFINTRSQNYLYPVRIACTKCIDNSNLIENQKYALKKFLNLCGTLENTPENVCILVLIYAQILKIADNTLDKLLPKYIGAFSIELSEKLRKINTLKVKNPKLFSSLSEDLKRINNNPAVYVFLFRSIVQNILKDSKGIESIYDEIKLDIYSNLIPEIKQDSLAQK